MNNFQSKGFTLVEVMVALAILAISLPALFYVLNQQTRQAVYLERRMMAQWVAANVLTEAHIQKRAGRAIDNKTTGVSDMGVGQQWHWQLDQEPVTDGSMRRLIVTVKDDQGMQYARLSLLLEP